MLPAPLAAVAITQSQAPAIEIGDEGADVTCTQALTLAWATATPERKGAFDASRSFYMGRLTMRGSSWRNDLFRLGKIAVTKENYMQIAGECAAAAIQVLQGTPPT